MVGASGGDWRDDLEIMEGERVGDRTSWAIVPILEIMKRIESEGSDRQ